jgi:hypothetical protein
MDRYEATWQLLVSYFHGLLIGNLLFLPLVGLLASASSAGGAAPTLPAVLMVWIVGLPIALIFSVVGGAILGFPILLLAWVILLIFLDRVRARLKPWCIVAPVAVAVLWFLGEYTNLAYASASSGWREFLIGVGPRVALVLLCASLSSLRYYRSARIFR